MAMISCPNCGKPVSDKAEKCPHCGFELTPATSNLCPECGNPVPEGAAVCPICGCPVDNSPQKVEVTRVKISKKVIIAVVSVAIVLVVAVIAGLVIRNYTSEREKTAYQEALGEASVTMFLQGLSAESCGGLIHDVWYNTIYKVEDYSTDEYTQDMYGNFRDDFNTSLAMLFADEDFTERIDSLRTGQETVSSLMKDLTSPPDGFESAHDAVFDLYDAYTALTNLAISPSGNLQTYTENFNNADSNFANCYEALQIYITD